MLVIRGPLLAGALALLVCGCAQEANFFAPSAPSGTVSGYGTCEAEKRGIEFTSYLPDNRRYVFVTTSALPAIPPQLLVIIDKNYDAKARPHFPVTPDIKLRDEETENRIVAWSMDRTRPFQFSTNVITITWGGDGKLEVPIQGLVKRSTYYEGIASSNQNTYAFQILIPVAGFSGDDFDVTLPAVTYDGATVSPPAIHFTRTDATILSPGKC